MSRRGRKGFSPQFERDYTFYLSNKDTFTFAGTDVKRDYSIQFPGEPEPLEADDDGVLKPLPFAIPHSPTGKSAKVCFYKLDSEGKCKPCSEPELLFQILRCKASINLQIKIWAQSRAEYTLSKEELLEYMQFYQAPDWVFKAIENQKLKILKEWAAEKKYESDYYKRIFELHMAEFLEEISQGSGVILDPNNSTNLSQEQP
jgi:hypothetical protein